MKRFRSVVFLVCYSLYSANGFANTFSEDCEDCHGKSGHSEKADIPSIAGISEYYFLDMMEVFSEGGRPSTRVQREDGSVTNMQEIAARLSRAELEKLAGHYSSIEFVRRAQPFDEGKARFGKKIHQQNCERCHQDAGRSSDDDAGLLAGQSKGYLSEIFSQLDSGQLTLNKKMMKKINSVKTKYGKDGFSALVDYYASEI